MFFYIKSLLFLIAKNNNKIKRNKKMKKNLKLVGLLALFLVLIIPIFYLGSSIRSVADQELLDLLSLEILNNEDSLIGTLLMFIILPILGWIVLELTDMVLEVSFLFSGFIFSLSALFGGYLMFFIGDGFFLSSLSFVGGMISFFMILLLMRTCLIWQSRRAVKKN